VAQQKLNAAYVCAGFQQMDRIGVAKRMRTWAFLQTGALASLSDGALDCIPRERLVGILSGEHPFPRPRLPPIAAQQLQELGG
jgi:hypothetical protein